jgi:D-ribose pyranose/furanose isomerase RbsD
MVKNLNTIEKSERIRIGKHVPDEQAVNTIIINASSNVIHAPEAGLYISPIRLNNSLYSNVICYDVTTKEVIDSGIGLNLQGVTETGNSTTETLQFMNTTTSFITASNVGIANTNPQHELSVGGDTYIAGNLTVVGQTTSISTENLRVKDAIIELGENNTDDDFVFDLGLIMTRPGSNVTASYIESSNEYIIGYTQNSASDTFITPDTSNLIQMRVYGDVTANSFIGDGSLLSNVVQDTDLSANLDVIRSEMAANTIQLREDLQSNASILRDEMTANTIQLREDLQSNASILRDEMTANTIQLREDLQSNASILRDEMTANTIQLREDLQSNANILRDEMAANTVTIRGEMTANTLQLRTDLQSNASILRDEMAANTVTIRGEMTANTLQLRTDLQSNATILRSEMAANVITIRGEMAANTLQLRTDLQSNVSTLRSEMAANTISIREEMQSNLALKANIESPVFTGIITGDGGGISNISLQHVTEYGNSTDRTITMSNALALITSGNVGINTPTPQRMLHVAGDILADDDIIGVDFYGDDATFTGGLTVSKDTLIYGNLEVRGNTTYLSTQNLLVEDPILALGVNNASSSLDTGLIVLVYQGSSNVAFGYRGDEKEFIIGHTLSSPEDNQLVPDTSNSINVHVYGDVIADSFIGDGGLLSNIASNLHQIALNGNITSETIILDGDVTGLSVTNNVFVGGNVTASSFTGDGGLLSNIASNLHQIALNGNITSETIILDGDVTGLSVTNNVFVGGNVTASSFTGDGGLLSNIASNLHQIALNGNITSETIILDGDITGLSVTNNVFVGGNVTASSFTGDGGLLSNIAATLQEVTDNGNTTTNTLQFTNPTTAFITDLTSNVGVKVDQLANVIVTSPQADHLLVYDGANWINDYSIHNFIKVHNNTGDTLHRGNAVYIVDSFNNNVANVALAKSDSSSTMPAIGLIHEDVPPGEEGVAVAYGKVNGLDTTGYTEGQTVYVSNTSAGNIMNTKPYGLTDQIQNVGICIRSHGNNGVIFVTGVGRSNDIPNAPISSSPNYVYVNETNNDMKKIAPENLLTKLQTLEQVVNTGNTVSNSIEITGNLTVSQNVSIGGLTTSYIPFVGAGNYLEDSTIRKDNGNIIISANTEITGDLLVTGNSYVISSNNVVIEDRILGLANNNPSHDYDTGIIIEHPGHNIALIHHGDEDRFSMGYTQNTVTDTHVLPDSNIFLLDILGNVTVQNNLTVGSGGSYFGDGTTLTGVALETDLIDNVSRISVLETDLTSNASRISVLELQDLDDIVNIGNVTSNTIQLTNIDVGLVATGNIEANYFLGDGSLLENVASNLERIVIGGNVTSQTIQIENVVSLTTTGNVGIANSNPTCDLAIGSNVCFNDTGSNVLTIDGNILAHRITLDSIQIASVYALEYVTQTGNTTSNTVEFTNESTGLVTTANVGVANANPIHTLDVGSNLWVDDVGSNVLYVNGNVHVAGAQLTTDGKVGIANTNPQHDLSVASNLYVDDVGSNVLVVHGNASIGTTLTVGAIEITPAYTLEEVTGQGNVTSNVIQFTNSNVGIISSGGIIINKDAYACKHYAYSNTSVPTDFSNVSMTFASNVFHAKITAQLTHGNEEVSTMILDVQGGTRDGTTSSLNIASGPGSVFGNTNTKPWSGSVGTTPTSVILEPSDVGTTTYGIDLYVEYKSSATDGKLESISIGTESVKSFIY